ncbi:MAG: Gfo/Idh/MocA family protein [Planctomycetota bacterium]|jgi:predicted dehydrogenase
MLPVRIGIVGVGGFANNHLHQIEEEEKKGRAKLAAAVIRSPEKYPEKVEELNAKGTKIYKSLEELLDKAAAELDIMCIPTGIADHKDMSIKSMEAGLDVYVEKPPAATIEDVDAMIKASKDTNKFCTVGFQSQSQPHILELKSLLVSGGLGELKEFACFATWPRADQYYARNSWAGNLKAYDEWVMDGPMNNALAHQIMNLLFFAGKTRQETATPLNIRAEMYRARDITGEDTDCLTADLEDGKKMYYCVTHATANRIDPTYRIVGSKGKAEGEILKNFKITLNDGESFVIGSDTEKRTMMLGGIIDYYIGQSHGLSCTIEMTRNMTLTLNCAYESSRIIHTIPEQYVKSEPQSDDKGTVPDPENCVRTVDGLDDAIKKGFQTMQTFSDMGLPWAVKTESFSTAGYDKFTGADLLK